MAKVNPVPEGFNTVSIHLVVGDAVEAIELYKRAFGAKEVMRLPGPDGQSTMHAEVAIGNSRVMLAEEMPECQMRSPKSLGGCAAGIHLYVEDADAVFQQAVDAGCEPAMPLMDAFWGDRYGKVKDPWGHEWSIASHQRDLTEEEIAQGAAEWMAQMSQAGAPGG